MGEIKLSAFADEYAGSFDAQLSVLERFGIGNIEFRHVNGKNISVLSPEEVKEAKKKMDAVGIHASAIGSPIGKIKLDDNIDAHLEKAKNVFATQRF